MIQYVLFYPNRVCIFTAEKFEEMKEKYIIIKINTQ